MNYQSIKKAIITTMVMALLFSLNTIAQDKVIDQIVAVVGGNVILKSDIERATIDKQAQGITSEGDMKCEILEEFLVNKLLVAEAELDTNITVTASQVNQQMDYQMQMYLSHFGSEAAVERYFKEPIATIKSKMQTTIKNQILSSQKRSAIVKDVTITPSEVRNIYKTADIKDIPIIPTQYRYAQITVRPRIEIEESNRIKARLRELKEKIENGSSFATMAVLYSEGPSSKNGGEIGYNGRAELDPAYASVAFNLKEGKVSNVVESAFGYHIIQVIDKRDGKINTRHILMTPKISIEAKLEASERLDSLAKIIRKDDIEFAKAAQLYSSDESTRNNGGIVVNPKDMSSKFKIEDIDPKVSKVLSELKINEISETFESIDERTNQPVLKIVKLLDKIEEHRANLREDYQTLNDLYLDKKREEKINQWIQEQQSKTYIRIDDTYANCNFEFSNWIK